MDINRLKEKLRTEKRKKELEVEKLKRDCKNLPDFTCYRKEGWANCLDWVLSEIVLLEEKRDIELKKLCEDNKWTFKDATGF